MCGSEGQNLIDNLCEPCFWRERLDKFPKEFKLVLCNYCFSQLHGKRWQRRIEKSTEDRIIESASQELQSIAELPKGLELVGISGHIAGHTRSGLPKVVELEAEIVDKESRSSSKVKSLAIIDYRLCNECYCLSSGKYDALIQIRGEGRDLDEDDRRLVEKSIEKSYSYTESRGRSDISEIKENEGGIDIKFMTLNVARSFVREFSGASGASVTESAKIVGIDRRTGGQHFKTTIAIKIPSIKAGELLGVEGEVYQAQGYHRGRLVVRSVGEPGKSWSLSLAQLGNVRRIKADEIKRVRLESKSDSFGTFLDLDDMKFLELPRSLIPENMDENNLGLLVTLDGKEKVYRTSKGSLKD
jgi:nonsense-mediated mRNA decay protein 3